VRRHGLTLLGRPAGAGFEAGTRLPVEAERTRMQALIDTLRAAGLVVLLIVTRTVLLVIAIAMLAASGLTVVAAALGIDRLFHRVAGSRHGGDGERGGPKRRHRLSIHR
jgi:hypothetical protein